MQSQRAALKRATERVAGLDCQAIASLKLALGLGIHATAQQLINAYACFILYRAQA